MRDRESTAVPFVGFFAGVTMLVLGAGSVGPLVLGGERPSNLIHPPFWICRGLVAAGVVFIWLYFGWRAEATGGGANPK